MYEPYLGLKSNGKVRALVFEKLIFRFTQPNQVNDPFEIRPRVPMEAYTEEDIDRARERALKAGFPKENLDQCLGIFLKTSPRRMTVDEFVKLSQQTWERRAFSIAR